MTDYVREHPLFEDLNRQMRMRGLRSPQDFTIRFGVSPTHLTPTAALALLDTPDWVLDVWLPNSGTTPVVWIPVAVRKYAAALGIHQSKDESDHTFDGRIKVAVTERREAA